MGNGQFISYPNFLRYTKQLGRRFGMPLHRAQALLCRVCGFSGMFELQKHVQGDVPIRSFALEDWEARLRAELGGDLDEFLPEDERARWFRYIHRGQAHPE